MRARLAVACALGLVSGCYLAHERDAVSSSCIAPSTPVSCTAFEASGPPALVSGASDFSGAIQLQSVLATPCGVLTSWSTILGRPAPDGVAFETRTIDWTGAPAGDVLAHPALTVHPDSSGQLELVRQGPGSAFVLVSTTSTGCVVARLDDAGHDLAAPVVVGTDYCHDAEVVDHHLSFLSQGDRGLAPGVLTTVDATGALLASTSLRIPAHRSLWSRARFGDGSFLVYSFSEDPMTSIYSGWMQHFDPLGAALAPEVELGANGVPVQLVPTTAGAVAVWSTAESGGLPVQARAIDANAVATSVTRDLPATGALYGVVAVATPDGAVLVSWLEEHFHEAPEWRLRAQVLGPDATPRGEPTLLGSPLDSNAAPRLVLDLAGERALAVYDDDGVWALPLACVR